MALDIGSGLGFAKATLSSASGVLNQFTGLSPDTWDIQESSYGHETQVLFHVFTPKDFNAAVSRVQDNLSRRVIKFEFPYKEGQTTEDLGRNGQSFEFDILIHGSGYYAQFLALMDEFNDPRPGTLVHPVLGRLNAKFVSASIIHQSTERQAVAIHASFTEHNFDVSFDEASPTTKSTLSQAVSFLAKIDNVLNKVESGLFVIGIVKTTLANLSSAYKDAYNATLVSLNATFNNGSSADIPGLLPSNSDINAFPLASAGNDPFAGVTVQQEQQTSVALASLQAIDQVKSLRTQLNTLISALSAVNSGQGSLIFYDEILSLKQSSIAMQKALEIGLQSSKATIINYVVPILMDLREVCFANGLSPDRAYDLEVLNPSILSANYIEPGTVLQVPSS